jgi:hypothetical protein
MDTFAVKFLSKEGKIFYAEVNSTSAQKAGEDVKRLYKKCWHILSIFRRVYNFIEEK